MHPTSALLASMSRSPEDTFARLAQRGMLSPRALAEREHLISRLAALLQAADSELAAQSHGGEPSAQAGSPPSFGHRWLRFLNQEGYLSEAGAAPGAAAGSVAGNAGSHTVWQPNPFTGPRAVTPVALEPAALPAPALASATTPASGASAAPAIAPAAIAPASIAAPTPASQPVWPDPFAPVPEAAVPPPPAVKNPVPTPVTTAAPQPTPSQRHEPRVDPGPFDGLSVSHKLGFPVLAAATPDARPLSWRGLALLAPARLSPLPTGTEVSIVRRFGEAAHPLLRLSAPGGSGHCDWILRWVTADRTLALLDLAPGWPADEAERMVVVAMVGTERLRTLAQRECLRALGRILPEVQDRECHMSIAEAEAVLGAFEPEPVGVPTAASDPPAAPLLPGCLACARALDSDCDFCPHCGVRRRAPDCPACVHPVTPRRDGQTDGRDAWNTGWDGRCAACGLEFALRVLTPAVHAPFEPAAGTLTLTPEESTSLRLDGEDHAPVVRLRVTRAPGALLDPTLLPAAAELVLTQHELQAVIEALQGPLRVLLERKPWSRDTP